MTSLVDEELVLLTSYFNLANGRRQDSADTFRVDPNLASSTSLTGSAALYIVTEASGGSHMGPRARRMTADIISREYASNGSDSPAKRLKNAILAAHREIFEEFEGHVAVGASVIAVEHNAVYLAQVAPAQVYVLHDGNLHSNSPEPGGLSPFARSIGSSRTPTVTLARDEIADGDVLALCSSWFDREADQEAIRECFEFGSAEDITTGLFELCESNSARDATAIVIEAVPEADFRASESDEEDPGTFSEQVDAAVQALASVGRILVHELRPDPDEYGERANGRHARYEDSAPSGDEYDSEMWTASDTEYDDPVEEDGEREALVPRRRSRFWGATARRRSPYGDEQSTGEVDVLGPSTRADDPSATREVPAVGFETPSTRAGQMADPWNPEETAAYDLDELHRAAPPEPAPRAREQTTEEVPEVPPEAWAEAITADQERGAHDTGLPAPAINPEPEFDAWADVIEPEADVEPDTSRRPRFPRRRPRRPFRQEPQDDSPDDVDENAEANPRTQAELDEVNSRLQDDLDMSDVLPPVQGFADAGTEPSRIYATSRDIQAVNRRPRRFGGMGRPDDPSSGSRVFRPGSDLDLRRPVGRPAPNAVIWFAAAAVCVFAVLAAYLAIKHFRGHTVAVNPYPAEVRQDLRRALHPASFDYRKHELALATENLSLAKQGGASAATLRSLKADIASASDVVYGITRVAAPVVVGKFQQPSEIATGATSLIVLDPGKGAADSVQQNSTAAPTQIVTSGEVDGPATIAKLTQVATAGSVALVLDQNNELVRDDNGTKTVTLLQKASATQSVAGMINSGADVYLLDPAGSQIWKYANAVSLDNPAPTPFFPSGGPNLGKAVSFTMDDTSIYILQSNQTILKYDLLAHQQAFNLNLHVPLVHPDAVFTDVGLKYIWIADPGAGRIVEVDKSGNYVRSYASSNAAMNLHQLKSIAVQPDGKTLYALAGNQVFRFGIAP